MVRDLPPVPHRTLGVTVSQPNHEGLVDKIVALGPWHLDVRLTEDLSTAVYLDHLSSEDAEARVSFLRPERHWKSLMHRIYPDGLEGRSFLECACNCGAYSFWARELGASSCTGFDVREHWIEQARFLLQHRKGPVDGIRFEVSDLLGLEKVSPPVGPADITMFQGIFYHLPDPVAGLKIAADRTRELLFLDTACRVDLPDGMLAVTKESTEMLMSGVHGLAWYPTGPRVLESILRWLGFVDIKVAHWFAETNTARDGYGRIRVLASRRPGLLEPIESVAAPTILETKRMYPAAADD